jgi:DNA replication and repair protein RecF
MILALKFIEAQVLEKETGKMPVVLLDDIFSELDSSRQQHLIDNFKKYQMVVTSTDGLKGMEVQAKL